MNSAFAWPGGKRALLPTLLKLLPEHSLYVEVFCGSAKLLFAKEPSRREVINDLNGDVTNFFRVVKHRAAELAERLELECIHAGRFRELRAADPECEVDRALRFVYLTWYSFSAKGEHFASSNAKPGKNRRSLASVRETLQRTAERLASVQIEQRDFADILARYDSPGSFLYLDPPYVEFQGNGRYDPLDGARRVEMFRAIAKLKGKCLVSFDDHPEIRALAAKHKLHVCEVSVPYTIAGGHKGSDAAELLIANYPIELPAAA
jgi:DNA adenine methylase